MIRVYHCAWASQPDLRLNVDGEEVWTTPAWDQPGGLPEGVFSAESGHYYTFDREKVGGQLWAGGPDDVK